MRTLRGLSRAELSTLSGLSFQTIGQVERGAGKPQYGTILALAVAFGCAPSDLYVTEDQG